MGQYGLLATFSQGDIEPDNIKPLYRHAGSSSAAPKHCYRQQPFDPLQGPGELPTVIITKWVASLVGLQVLSLTN
jgi:hypothetical protein